MSLILRKIPIKTAATLTIHKADKMTLEDRKQVADWLCKQAKDLMKFGNQYGKNLICRYRYLNRKQKKIALVSYH
jgi:hypothetical protein